mgnify:CR=1 FL=1
MKKGIYLIGKEEINTDIAIIKEPYDAEKVLIYDTTADINKFEKMIEYGFKWLDTFEMLFPMVYDELYSKQHIPMYDDRIIFVRWNLRTKMLYEKYTKYLENTERKTAFIRAVLEIKPVYMPLPEGWIK